MLMSSCVRTDHCPVNASCGVILKGNKDDKSIKYTRPDYHKSSLINHYVDRS